MYNNQQGIEIIKPNILESHSILKPIIQKRFKASGKFEIIVFIVLAIVCITSAGYGFDYLKTASISSELHDILKFSLYMSGSMVVNFSFYCIYKRYPLLRYRLHEAKDLSYFSIQGKILKIIDEKTYIDDLQLQALIEYQDANSTTQQKIFDCPFPTQQNLYPRQSNYLVGKPVRLCLSPTSQHLLSIQVLDNPNIDVFFQVDADKKHWIFHHYGMELMDGIHPEYAIKQIDLVPESSPFGFSLYFHCQQHPDFKVSPILKNWVDFINYLEKHFKDIQVTQLKSPILNANSHTQILWKNPAALLSPIEIKKNRFRFHLIAILLMFMVLASLVLIRLFLFNISYLMILNFILIASMSYYLIWQHNSHHVTYQIIQSRYQL